MLLNIFTRYILAGVITVALTAWYLSGNDSLIYIRSAMDTELYRHITGQWTHGSYIHLLINYVGFVLVGIIFAHTIRTPTFLLWSLLISICTSLLLYVYDPVLQGYVGFSGALYGLLLACLIRSIPIMPWVSLLGIIAVAIRLYIEQTGLFDVNVDAKYIGAEVWVNAHLYGAYAGCAFGLISLIYNYYLYDEF